MNYFVPNVRTVEDEASQCRFPFKEMGHSVQADVTLEFFQIGKKCIRI